MSVSLREAGYRYAGATRPALSGISLELEAGQVLGVVGANQAGKSTLCLLVAGLAPATIGGELTGEVTLDGLATRSARPWELAQRCGIVFQNPATQLSGTTASVWEEVAFGPRNLGMAIADVAERVAWALDALAITELAPRDPERLSGGQAQLVALAGVLAMRPAYLVLDEPTSQLDPQGTDLVATAIATLADQSGAGVLLAEHKTDLLAQLANEVLVLGDGELRSQGKADDVLADQRLEGWGVEPPSAVRLRRAAKAAGVRLPVEAVA